MPLFQNTVLTKYLNAQDKGAIKEKWKRFKAHFHNSAIQENIRNSKEEQYQGEFLIDLFVNVLGYTKNPTPDFNLTTEYKNVKDSKKADGAIIFNDEVKAVIELKGTETTDLNKIEAQAFGYKNNQPNCKYVITSNFEKLRFYVDNTIDFIDFHLFELDEKGFEVLYLCLGYENLSKDIAAKVKGESLSQEDAITKQLYKDYSLFKRELFNSLVEANSQYDSLTLFKKSQKLLDRFLFLFFAEDRLLLPPNSIRLILQQWQKLQELDEYVPLYDRFKKYFGYLNTGFKGKQYDVFAYNGGLFKPDDILDTVTIDDDLLYKHTLKLSEYNFESEVDVNILGHIFENSLNEIEEIQAELEGQEVDKSKTKRKKDGVFYTPKYITKYIVENTVGKLCKEKKQELEITDENYQPAKQRSRKRLENLQAYREWLLNITICDPACGSGAFLNQALEFLIEEHRYIDELSAKYNRDSLILSDVENSILEHNLFGVDLNEEAVEIAKLSLWLRTAQKNRKLNDLSNNIKCGNSLIDDPEVAGDKAFNWENEFPEIFEKSGFDVVIGNPPYVSLESIPEIEKKYYRDHFECLERKYDTSVIFHLKAMNLLNPLGILSFITTVTWQTGENYKNVRKYLFDKYDLIEIVNLPFNVFADAYIDTGIMIFKNQKIGNGYKIYCYDKNISLVELEGIPFDFVDYSRLDDESRKVILDLRTQNLLENVLKRNEYALLGDISISTQGLSPSRFNIVENNNSQSTLFPYLKDGQIYHYQFIVNEIGYVDMTDKTSLIKFYESGSKILIRRLINRQDRLTVSFTDMKMVYKKDINPFIITDSNFSTKFVLTILASKLISYLYLNSSSIATKDDFRQTTLTELRNLPIIKASDDTQITLVRKAEMLLKKSDELVNFAKKFIRSLQRKFDELDKLSKKLESWHELTFKEFVKELGKKKIKLSLSEEAEWEEYFLAEQQKAQSLKAQIEATDKEIDKMVYELYGLTEDEIRIVEREK